jgi:hypothetical protein
MGHLVDAFEKWSKTPQAKTLFKGISDAIGPMIQSLGDIGGNVLLAIGQGFLDAKPYINQFLGWLKTVTKSWDDFTKRDPKGKSKFGDFLKSATDSLKAVWGVIKQIGTIIGQVFTVNAKTGAGNDLFKGISDSLTGVSNWLKDPKNQKSLEGWIKDAETLAQKLGDVVVAFTVMLTQLDTPRNRGWLFDVLDVVKNIFIWIGTTSVAVDDLATKLEGVIAQWQAAKQQEQIAHPPPTTEAGRIFEGGPITAIADLWKAFKTWSATNPIHMWVTGSGSGSLPGDLDAAGKAISTWASGLGGPDSGIGTLIGKLRQPFTDFYNWLASQPGLGVIIAGWVTQAQLGFTVLGPMLQQPFIDFYNWLASQPGLGVVMAGWITQLQSAFTGFGLWLDAFGASLILSIGNWFTNNQFLQGVLLAVNAIKQPFIDLYNFLIGHSLIPDLVNGIVDWFSRLPGMILGALGNLGSIFASWVASLPGQAATVAGQIRGAFVGLAGRIITAAGSIAGAIGTWFASLPGKASSIATQVRNAFNGLAGRIIGAAGSIAGAISGWFSSLPGRARSIASQIVNAFSGLAHRAISAAGSLASAIAAWTSGAYGRAKSAGDSIAQGLRDALSGVLGTINVGSLNIPASARKLLTASGGVFFGAQTRIIGEAGPEAVVPLNRPLSMVDPSVRALSAFAQGKSVDITATGRGGKTIEVGAITIITPTEDPRAVAAEVVARMAAASYI